MVQAASACLTLMPCNCGRAEQRFDTSGVCWSDRREEGGGLLRAATDWGRGPGHLIPPVAGAFLVPLARAPARRQCLLQRLRVGKAFFLFERQTSQDDVFQVLWHFHAVC